MKVARLISKLGGVPAVAAELSRISKQTVSTGLVYRWRDRDTISFRWRPYMAELVANRDIPLPPELAPFIAKPSSEAKAS